MIFIYTQILDAIKPTNTEREKIIKFSSNLMNIIKEHANELDIDVECRLVGSMAKKTSLKSKADIDIFMTFPLDYPEEDLKEYGLMLGEYCINKVNGKSEKRYASHPYMTGLIEGFEIDFVPCYRIKDAKQLKSAVDRTILHTDYILSHMSDRQADEVLLLKKFMSCVNTYGANYKVSGFSGYLCELLILEYGSFEGVIENASSNWHNNKKIDLEDYKTANKFKNPLVVIDPTDANRNVSAALSMQKYSEFIQAARNFKENPSKTFFENIKIETGKEELISTFEDRKTKTLILTFDVPSLPTDVIYPQINKTKDSLVKISNRYDFKVLENKYYINEDENTAHIILEYEIDNLSDLTVHTGPLVIDSVNSGKFLDKYPNAYIKENKWISLNKRKYTKIEDLLNDMLKKENISNVKVGKDVKDRILQKYQLISITEYLDKYARDYDLEEIYMYLYPNSRLIRK